MAHYSSKSGKKSGIIAYEIGDDFITVIFEGFKKYKYSHSSAGKSAVNAMKRLAVASQGLSTYIAQHKPIPE